MDATVDIVGIRFHDNEWESEYETGIDIITGNPVTKTVVDTAMRRPGDEGAFTEGHWRIEGRDTMPFEGLDSLNYLIRYLASARHSDAVRQWDQGRGEWDDDTDRDIFRNPKHLVQHVSTLYVGRLHVGRHTADIAAFWRPARSDTAYPYDDADHNSRLPPMWYSEGTSKWFNPNETYRFLQPRWLVLEADRAWGTEHGPDHAGRALAEDRPGGDTQPGYLWLDLKTGAVQAVDGTLGLALEDAGPLLAALNLDGAAESDTDAATDWTSHPEYPFF